MRIKIKLDEETRPIWDAALRARDEVAAWPAWKRGEDWDEWTMFCASWLSVSWAMTEQAGPGRTDPVWEERIKLVARLT